VRNKGINFLIPLIDQISYVKTLKEVAVEVESQTAITRDNVTLRIDGIAKLTPGVLYYRVVDPYKVSF
jgi:regulator of protease activity HflC (stomatin/prohibitin superfamily)